MDESTNAAEDAVAVTYEAPAIDTRISSRDPLVWTVTSGVCCPV